MENFAISFIIPMNRIVPIHDIHEVISDVIISYQFKLIKMNTELVNLNYCEEPF